MGKIELLHISCCPAVSSWTAGEESGHTISRPVVVSGCVKNNRDLKLETWTIAHLVGLFGTGDLKLETWTIVRISHRRKLEIRICTPQNENNRAFQAGLEAQTLALAAENLITARCCSPPT